MPQDYVKAMKYFTLAAEQGLADAQCTLGIMYGQSEGAPDDLATTTKWIQLSTAQGHADAIKQLSILQEHNMIP